MTKEYILEKLKRIKPKYEDEGIIFLGLFGSYAKNSATKDSDIDILYKLEIDKFSKENDGFTGFTRILKVKDELKNIFNKDIDLCSINGNSRTFKKFALKDVVYV